MTTCKQCITSTGQPLPVQSHTHTKTIPKTTEFHETGQKNTHTQNGYFFAKNNFLNIKSRTPVKQTFFKMHVFNTYNVANIYQEDHKKNFYKKKN